MDINLYNNIVNNILEYLSINYNKNDIIHSEIMEYITMKNRKKLYINNYIYSLIINELIQNRLINEQFTIKKDNYSLINVYITGSGLKYYEDMKYSLETLKNYFDIVIYTLNEEKDKKISLEERANFILALMGAILAYIFDKIKLKEVITNFNLLLTPFKLIKSILGVGVYVGFLMVGYYIYKIVNVRVHCHYRTSDITKEELFKNEYDVISTNIRTYVKIIENHRENNIDRVKYFKKLLNAVIVTFIMIIGYIGI